MKKIITVYLGSGHLTLETDSELEEAFIKSVSIAFNIFEKEIRSKQIKTGLELKKTKQNKGLITAGCALAI